MAGRIPARLSPAEGRKFGFTVGLAFGVLAGITWWRDHPLLMQVFGGLAVVLILAGALIPGRLGPVYRAWMGLALLISPAPETFCGSIPTAAAAHAASGA